MGTHRFKKGFEMRASKSKADTTTEKYPNAKSEVSDASGSTYVTFAAGALHSRSNASALVSQGRDVELVDIKPPVNTSLIHDAAKTLEAVPTSLKTQQTKRPAQDASEGSRKRPHIQSHPSHAHSFSAPIQQAQSGIRIAQLPAELKVKIFQHLSTKDLFSCIRVDKATSAIAIKVLWRKVTLDFTKRKFPKAVYESWQKQELWVNTKMVTIGMKKSQDMANLLAVLRTIPQGQIEYLAFHGYTLLGQTKLKKISRFLDRQSKIQFQSCVRSADAKCHPVSYSVRLEQAGKHQELKELLFIRSDKTGDKFRDDLSWRLLDDTARATSVEAWGDDGAFGRVLDCDFWARIAALTASRGLLKEVNKIHLKNLDLTNTVERVSEMEKYIEIANLEHLAIQDCPGGDQFLVAIQDSTPAIKSLLLRDSLNHTTYYPYQVCYDFIKDKASCEELSLDFVQDAASLPANGQNLIPLNAAGNLKKLVLRIPTPTTDQAPCYLVETLKICPNLTHVSFVFDHERSPSMTHQITPEWKEAVQALGVLLKGSIHLSNVHLALPTALNEDQQSDIQPEAYQTAAILAENGFMPSELSFTKFHYEHVPRTSSDRAQVYKIRHHEDGRTVTRIDSAEDWTMFGYSGSMSERLEKVSGSI